MRAESIVFTVAGAFFGLLVGWIVGSQQTRPPAAPAAVSSTAQASPASASSAPEVRAVDEARVRSLGVEAQRAPADPRPRVQLGDLFFDAGRFDEAVRWYEEALKLNPKDVNVSTDLGVAYHYLNQTDRALQQFDHSLAIDAGHTKTLLNQGIVRAFGKQDLQGAVAAWKRLIELAPDSPEAASARRAIQDLEAAHPNLGRPTPGGADSPVRRQMS